MMGATKQGEYARSAELFEEVFAEQGAYFALALLLDSGYDRADLVEILKHLKGRAL